MKEIECHICGVCCKILSISSLNKPAYERCKHLLDDNRCNIYTERPEVCRRYKADELCYFISDLEQDIQYEIFKAVYGE